MSSHDSHGLSPREPKLRLEEVYCVVSGPLWVWLGLGLGSSVGHWVAGHTVTPPVLELNLSREVHLEKAENKALTPLRPVRGEICLEKNLVRNSR